MVPLPEGVCLMSKKNVILYIFIGYFLLKYLVEPSFVGSLVGGILAPFSTMVAGLFPTSNS
jgi:hypothetical protein